MKVADTRSHKHALDPAVLVARVRKVLQFLEGLRESQHFNRLLQALIVTDELNNDGSIEKYILALHIRIWSQTAQSRYTAHPSRWL